MGTATNLLKNLILDEYGLLVNLDHWTESAAIAIARRNGLIH